MLLYWILICFKQAVARGKSQHPVIRRPLVQFPWSACPSVLGQDTEPQNTAPGAGWHLAWQPASSVYELL